jgi:sulfate transport system ATP-binding protein
MTISVQHVSRRFGEFKALDDVSLEIPGGSLVALLGPSGSGKTTLLRILAGLDRPDHGAVLHDGADLIDQRARDRNVGLVFQHYALFRHLDVAGNVGFALKVRKRPKAEIKARVDELLELVQLDGLQHRLPSQLSGGQRQRVALARALAASPSILLLDEPFGALDAQVRQELRRWLRRLHDELHVTTVFVTHDQEEAFEVADRIVVMDRGRIEQVGTPAEVFDHPASDFVMRFLGQVNILDARVEHGRAHIGDVILESPALAGSDATAARVYIRPHELELASSPTPGHLPARVVRVVPIGAALRVEISPTSLPPLHAEVDRTRGALLSLEPGADIYVSLRRARVFPDARQAA